MDRITPFTILKSLLPKIPLMIYTTLAHLTRTSPQSGKWDLKTALIVNVLRAFVNPEHRSSISNQQKFSLTPIPVKGKIWIAKVAVPVDEEPNNIREEVGKIIETLGPDLGVIVPDIIPVEAEWTGNRAGVGDEEPEIEGSEQEKYDNLVKERKGDTTILYFHGGAYYLMDPATHRKTTRKLAKDTSGQVLSVRYRLAPQHPFPAGLLDALIAYLYLLNPPPGSLHKGLAASEVILSGDSAGGGLALALLQLILQLNRRNVKLLFFGKYVSVDIPAGVVINSGWFDITMSMPSIHKNLIYDFLPPGSDSLLHAYPPSPAWPTTPVRNSIYAPTTQAQLHPLASTVLAKSWEGSPPVLFICGEELLTDESLFLAKRVAEDTGGNVGGGVWMFEAQCHTFAQIQPTSATGSKAFRVWSEFCSETVRKAKEGQSAGGLDLGEKDFARVVKARTLEEVPASVEELSTFSMDDVKRWMQARVDIMEKRERDWIAEHQGKSIISSKL